MEEHKEEIVHVVEKMSEEEPYDPDFDPNYNDISNFYTNFQKLSLNDANKQLYNVKVSSIDQTLVENVEEANATIRLPLSIGVKA